MTAYVTGLGISVEEARRRNDLVEVLLAGDLFEWLEKRGDFFWVEESAEEWTLVIGREHVFSGYVDKVEERVAGTPLDGFTEIRAVEHDLEALLRAERRVTGLVREWCLPQPTGIEIDYAANTLVIGVQSVDQFLEAADLAGVSLGSSDVVVEERPAESPPGADTEPCEGPLGALARARDAWASHDLDGYAYQVTAWSAWFGPTEMGEVRVWNGDITWILPPELTPDDLRYPSRFAMPYGTVDELLDIVASYPVQWLTVFYSAEWGFPTSVSFDNPRAIDEEWGFRISSFRVLESPPDPAPPRAPRHDWSLAIERHFPWEVVVVDAVIGPSEGHSAGDWGWRHTLEVTDVVYSSPGAVAVDVGPVEVVDGGAPRALLHRDGDTARLILTHGFPGNLRVFAVIESTPDGLRFEGSIARSGYSEEIGYLCHYPRTDIPTDPPPERNAEAEFELFLRWLDERGPFDPEAASTAASKGALRRVCEQE